MPPVAQPVPWPGKHRDKAAQLSMARPLCLLLALLDVAQPAAQHAAQQAACPHQPSTLATPATGTTSTADRNRPAGPGGHLRAAAAAAARPSRPHIALFLFDDLGFNDIADFAAEEGGGHTPCTAPVMQRLMAGGVKLKQFYAQPICSPTRSAIMTARYPIRYGGQTGTAEGVRSWVPEGEPMLPERLTAAGYECHIVGKWHLGHAEGKWMPTARGFSSFFGKYRGGGDHWTHQMAMNADTLSGGWWPGSSDASGVGGAYVAPPVGAPIDLHHDTLDTATGRREYTDVLWENGTHSTTLFGREAARVVEQHDPTAAPLFLYAAHQAPHWPVQPTASGWLRNAHLAAAGASERRRHWCGIVTAMDESMGSVVGALEMKNMMEDTIIIASSDK